ncbi:MAG: Smr/MutS family protein [Hyphomicrobiales bacterium]|nr:Smr/MutS family protein [Hyphomicrobiales bacterium]
MMAQRKSGKRILTDEERQLWAKVKKTVVPLDPAVQPQAEPSVSAPPAAAGITGKTPPPGKAKPVPAVKGQSIPTALDRKTRTRLSRGASPVGATIDLHGMRQDEAHRALRGFLIRSQQRGDRFVIVVTGKGSRTYQRDPSGYGERGVLRSVVPQWLSTDGFRDVVVGYSEAAPAHGGGGALYVQIRRRRTPVKEADRNGLKR